jgi:hypothetical protein
VTTLPIDAAIAMLLMPDQELITTPQLYWDQPAAVGSVSRPAAAQESARRSRLSAHEWMAKARERRENFGSARVICRPSSPDRSSSSGAPRYLPARPTARVPLISRPRRRAQGRLSAWR